MITLPIEYFETAHTFGKNCAGDMVILGETGGIHGEGEDENPYFLNEELFNCHFGIYNTGSLIAAWRMGFCLTSWEETCEELDL